MSQGWGAGGGGGGGWGQPGGGYPPPPPGGGGYGPPPGGAPPPGGFGGAGGGGFAPPPPGYPPGYTPMATGGAVAWEDKSLGAFGRWWGTTKGALFDTRRFYAGAAQSEDPWPAITYSAVSAALGGFGIGITVALMYLVLGSIGAMAASGSRHGSSPGGAAGAVAIMGAMGVAAVIIYPILSAIGGFIGPWITGGIYHVTLLMFRGANRPFTSTVRVVGYGHAYYLWMMIPVFGYAIGWLPAMIFGILTAVVGLDETHKCGIGKAIGAVFLIPGLLALCCCGAYAAVIASAISAHR